MLRRPAWLAVIALAIAPGAVVADEVIDGEDPRPWLGISYDGRPSKGIVGLPVTNVFEESGALASGLRAGDEIVEIDGDVVMPGSDLYPIISPRAIGDRLTMRVYRDDKIITLHPVLTRRVSDSEMLHRQLVGKRAPAFSLARVGDDAAPAIEDSVLVGKVGIVVWFHQSCRDCPQVINALAPWIEAHRRDGVVGVAGANGEEVAISAILQSTPVLLPVGIDQDAWLHYGLLEDFQNKVSICVVDRAGVVRMAAAVGAVEDPALDDVIAAAESALKRKSRR
jgi:hypothetical protein